MTAETVYRRRLSGTLPRPLKPGPVLFWRTDIGEAVVFSCPCGEREVYATTLEGHEFEWDADLRLTVQGSLGSRPKDGRPLNWCHFFMRDGEVEMCSDAQCGGK